MLPDDRDERPRPDPRAGGCGRIEIIDCAAGRVHPVERIARGTIGALRDRLIELSIADARKGPALIDDTGERVRERRVLDAVHWLCPEVIFGLSTQNPGFVVTRKPGFATK